MPEAAKYGRDFFPRFNNSRYGKTKKSLMPTIRVNQSPGDFDDVRAIDQQNQSLKALLSSLQTLDPVQSQADVHPFTGYEQAPGGVDILGYGGLAGMNPGSQRKTYGASPREERAKAETELAEKESSLFDIEPRKLQLEANILKQIADYRAKEEQLERPKLSGAKRPERKELERPKPTKPDVPLAAMIASTLAGMIDPKMAGRYASAPMQAGLAHADYQDERNLEQFGYDQRRADIAYQDQSQIAEDDAQLANQNATIGFQNQLAGQDMKRNQALSMIQAQGSEELAKLGQVESQNRKASLMARASLGQKERAVNDLDRKAAEANAQVLATQKMYLDLGKSVINQGAIANRQQAGFQNQKSLQEDRQSFQQNNLQDRQTFQQGERMARQDFQTGHQLRGSELAKSREIARETRKTKTGGKSPEETSAAAEVQRTKELLNAAEKAKSKHYYKEGPLTKDFKRMEADVNVLRSGHEAAKKRLEELRRPAVDTKAKVVGKETGFTKTFGGAIQNAAKAGHAGAHFSARSATGEVKPPVKKTPAGKTSKGNSFKILD